MDLMEQIALYPNIAAAVAKMGKVKKNGFTKKRYAEAEEILSGIPAEDLQKLDYEIASAEPLCKTSILTPTAIVYWELSVVYIIPVKDVCWMYTEIVKNTMNYIFTTGRNHRIWMVDRTGRRHIIFEAFTGPFVKKQPATEALGKIREKLYNVRRGIIYGFSHDIDQWFVQDAAAAAAKVDADSNLEGSQE